MAGRMKPLQVCGCGCGVQSPWHRLHLLRGPDNASFFVLDGCRDEFEKELGYWKKLKEICDALRGSWFFTRWRAGAAWMSLQFLVRVRLLGADKATHLARRDTIVFVLPRWMARIYIKFTKT